MLIVQSRFQSIFIFKLLIFFRAVFLEQKQRDVGFLLALFYSCPHSKPVVLTHEKFLSDFVFLFL